MKNPLKKRKLESTRRLRQRTDNSAPVKLSSSFTYHARRSDVEPNSRRQISSRLRGSWTHRIGAVILLIALVVSAINILSLSNEVTIVPLTKGSPFLHATAAYESAATNILSESILNRSKLTLDSARISRELTQKFPELSSVTVTIPLLAHKPVVYVQTAQPALILSASNGSFVLSDSGKALIPSSQLSNSSTLDLPTLGDQSGISVTLNQQALPTDNIRFIRIVVAQLKAKNYTIGTMTLPPTASELDVAVAGQPYFIKLNLQSNTPREQVGTFLATVAQLNKQNQTPSKYVDVRVDGRAYYQ